MDYIHDTRQPAHVDQLLIAEGSLAVLDFDQMCLAAPALDLAAYAADVVRGRASDIESVQAVLEPLLEGYGGRPDGMVAAAEASV